jgi:hypothetical protein
VKKHSFRKPKEKVYLLYLSNEDFDLLYSVENVPGRVEKISKMSPIILKLAQKKLSIALEKKID